MRKVIRTLAIALCLGSGMGLSTVSCTAMTGKTAGQNVDDATITAEVKSKLATEKVASLVKIDVDTNKGTVYLNGNVDSTAMKDRAGKLASQVSGVQQVVNNLKIRGS